MTNEQFKAAVALFEVLAEKAKAAHSLEAKLAVRREIQEKKEFLGDAYATHLEHMLWS